MFILERELLGENALRHVILGASGLRGAVHGLLGTQRDDGTFEQKVFYDLGCTIHEETTI